MKLSITFGLLMLTCCLYAQVPVRQAISGLGGYYAREYSSSETVGEAIITTAASDMYVLTQGFQQPDELDLIVGLREPTQINHAVRVFPNPCASKATLSIEGLNINMTVLVRVYTNNGKLLKYEESGLPVTLDMANEAAGSYLVVVWDEAGTWLGSAGIVKQ